VRRLALVAFALAFAFGTNELLLRAFWTNPFAREQPDPVLILRWHHPGFDQELGRTALHLDPPTVRFRIDERGYIEPSRQFDAPEFTLAFQGGSTTECLVVQEDLRWPNRVSAELQGLGFRANVRNAGKSGNTAHDALVNLVQFVAPDRPDVVLLMNGVNDAGLLAEGGYALRAPQPDGWRAGLRWLGETASRHSSLVGFVRRSTTYVAPEIRHSPDDPAALARAPESQPYEARVRAWVRTARAFGIEPVLITEPLSTLRNELTPPWTDAGALAAFNQKVREIGRDEGAVVIDLAELVKAEPEWARPESIYYDGMHVNDAGARIYGRLVANALARDVLPRLRAARAAQPPQIAR
jgi:lysophospholipase L1-like esterase